MKYVSLLLVAMVGAGLCAAVSAAEPASNDKAADTIRHLEEKWASAAAKKDAGPLENLLADDYVLTISDGRQLDKSTLVDALKDGTFAVDSATYSDMKVRTWGDTAVATGRLALKAKWGETDIGGNYAFTDTFVRHDGKWQEIAAQTTRLDE